MFTGIVREMGHVRQISHSGDTKVRIGCARPVETIEIGASIACNGVCLTVVTTGHDADGGWFEVDASAETRSKTTVGDWTEATLVNLEPALRLGDELGGHIVSGHVDGVAQIVAITPDGDSHRVTFEAAKALAGFIAPKGSVTIDGISLTVNGVSDSAEAVRFDVNIIPHTWAVTSLQQAAEGTMVNVEIDVLARYVKRLAEVV